MRWGRIIKDVHHWYDDKIMPLIGDDHISMGKVKEEYKEFRDAVHHWEAQQANASPDGLILGHSGSETQYERVARQHVEAEAADLFIALVCYCHGNNINLKRAVYATYLKLQKRKWTKTKVPGLVRHVEGT